MDLFEIFSPSGNKDEKDSSGTGGALEAKPSTSTLESQAQAAAKAFDAALSRKQSYDFARERLLDEIEEKLAEKKQAWEEAQVASDSATAALQITMEELGVSKIPMEDRKAISLKVTPGRKKSITKKWLTQEFGPQHAGEIWDKVPTGPEKTSVVIPPRYEDEPSD